MNKNPFKVVLINPAFQKIIRQKGMSFHYHKKLQPLCLAYIASLCRTKGIEVQIVDANIEGISSTDKYWKTLQADVFVITTASLDNWQCPFLDLDDIRQIMDRIHSKNPFITYGPLVTEKPEFVLEKLGQPCIGVRGEPEFTAFEVIRRIYEKKEWKDVEGISYIDTKTKRCVSTKAPAPFPLSSLPTPAYDLLPMHKYVYEILGDHFCAMEASRGCPFRCTFCLKNMYRNTYSPQEPKRIIEEIKRVQKEYSVRNIFFIDLEFTIHKQNTIALCKEIIDNHIKIRYAIQARVDSVDDELLYWLKKSGCVLIHYGVESGDAEILKATNKKVTCEQIEDAFSRIRKAGIKTVAFFTLGHPAEKREDILKTIEFSKKLNPDYASFVIIIPYPGTAIYTKQDLSVLYLGANKNMSLEELENLRKKAIRDFYVRPRYIWMKILSVRDSEDIKTLWRGFRELFIPLS